jgi:RNA polymerase sigma factor (TIGR02999 family)
MADGADEITELLRRLQEGDASAEQRLAGIVYEDLRRLAYACMRDERGDHTLQPTALIHEAWIRLMHDSDIEWKNRTHFLALASRAMRRVLVEYARRHRSQKRTGPKIQVELNQALVVSERDIEKVLIVEDALQQLSVLDGRQADVVEMRYFGGLTEDEIGAILGISSRTVKRDWRMARAWLAAKFKTSGQQSAASEA